MISLKIWSDCGTKTVECDATVWFEQAELQNVIELAEGDFRGDYAVDDIAHFMRAHDPNVEDLFQFLEKVPTQPLSGETNGFECSCDAHNVYYWLKKNKPEWEAEVRRAAEDDWDEDDDWEDEDWEDEDEDNWDEEE